MNYPEVLGHSIKIMPLKFRSLEWFETVAPIVQSKFWEILEDYNPAVAAEYLRDNHPAVPPFTQPLIVRGTLIGKLSTSGVAIYLPSGPKHYPWTDTTLNWAYVGVVEYGDRVLTPVGCHLGTVCARTRNLACKFVDNGAKVEDILIGLYSLKLEQIEMINNSEEF